MAPNELHEIRFEEREDPPESQREPAKIAYKSGPFRRFSMETQDVVAIGAVVLCVGAVLVAVIVALGFAFGKIEGSAATKIILGCVGGASISGVVGVLFRKGKQKRTTK